MNHHPPPPHTPPHCPIPQVIHAVLPDGSTVKGVEVFRRVYDAIGLGWVYAGAWPLSMFRMHVECAVLVLLYTHEAAVCPCVFFRSMCVL